MNILVTGGAGFIGSHTALSLLNRGFKPIILDNFSNSEPSVLTRMKKIAKHDFSFVEDDINDVDLLEWTMVEHNINCVFYFAALKAAGESGCIPLKYYKNSVSGTITLLEAMQKYNLFKFVFSSSATVYGEPQYLPIDESHPIAPTNPYEQTKAIVKQILSDHCQANPEFFACALRYFNPAGAHVSGLLGEKPMGVPNNLMPYVVQTAAGIRQKVNIFGNDYNTADGTGVRDYIHISDLVDGHVAALESLGTKPDFHAINLGTGKGYSVLELISAFSSINGTEIDYEISNRRPGDIASSYANPPLANTLLNWKAKFGLDDMVKDAWKWQQSNI